MAEWRGEELGWPHLLLHRALGRRDGRFLRALVLGQSGPPHGLPCSWEQGCVTATRRHISFTRNLLLGKIGFNFSTTLPIPRFIWQL